MDDSRHSSSPIEAHPRRGAWFREAVLGAVALGVTAAVIWWLGLTAPGMGSSRTTADSEISVEQLVRRDPVDWKTLRVSEAAANPRPPAPVGTKSVYDDRVLYQQVLRDIETHPLVRRNRLLIEVAKIENGYVTLGLLNGPGGLALELTGESWFQYAAPGFDRELDILKWGVDKESNFMVCVVRAEEEPRRLGAQACASLEVAIRRNPRCKGVFWTELPAARARRLFVEAGVLFWSASSPFGRPLRDAYVQSLKKKGLEALTFAPGIYSWLNDQGMLEIGPDLAEKFRPFWGTERHAALWHDYLLRPETSQQWFRTYREAWRIREFWDHVGLLAGKKGIPAERIATLSDDLTNDIRSGKDYSIPFDLNPDDLIDALNVIFKRDPSFKDLALAIVYPAFSLALVAELEEEKKGKRPKIK